MPMSGRLRLLFKQRGLFFYIVTIIHEIYGGDRFSDK